MYNCMLMKRHLVFILFLFVLPGLATAHVKIIGNQLTVHVDQILLQDFLKDLAKLGINIRVDPLLNPRITASFEKRELQKGLASIFKDLEYALVWEKIDGPSGLLTRLSTIQVYKPGGKGLIQPLLPPRALTVLRNGADGSMYIKDEILIGLKPGTRVAEFEKLLDRIHGIIVDRNPAIGIYKIRLKENADVPALVDQVANDPAVSGVEPNYAYQTPIPYKNSTPYDGRETDLLSLNVPNGTAPVAILDTGLKTNSGIEGFVINSLNTLNPGYTVSDIPGHGTQMALISSGVVKPFGAESDSEEQVPIIPIRVFDENGFTSNFAIMQGIDFALENRARVLNLSWGSDTESKFLEQNIAYAHSKGLITVASAGNEPTGKKVYPAAYASVISVGALGPNGKQWVQSNYGATVHFFAPGFAALPVGYRGKPGIYAGTSISAAYLSNVIANYLSENPTSSFRETIDFLSGHDRLLVPD